MDQVANLADWFPLSNKRTIEKLTGIENLLGALGLVIHLFSLVKCLCFSQAINLASEIG